MSGCHLAVRGRPAVPANLPAQRGRGFGDNGAGVERGYLRAGERTIAYSVRRSARRRRTVTITVEAGTGVRVAAPRRVTAAEIQALLLRRSGWILRRLDSGALPVASPRQFVDGERLPCLGQWLDLRVEAEAVRQVRVERDQQALIVSVPAGLDAGATDERRAAIVRALERWFRVRAAEAFDRVVERWSPLVGATPRAVLVRAQRQRWGSCSASGVLRLNWRLVLAPPELLDYVVVHELAHLRVTNHSAAFWAEVARVLPEWKTLRRRLGEIGPSLTL